MTKEGEINRQTDRLTDIRTKSKNTGAAAGTPQNATCLSHNDDDDEEEEEEEKGGGGGVGLRCIRPEGGEFVEIHRNRALC